MEPLRIDVETWCNAPADFRLDSLRGRIVVLHTFQLLCPGCVIHALPQIARIEQAFADTELAVVGLHTVFEHHEAMHVGVLRAFLHEYRIKHPVGVDRARPGQAVPSTMARLGLRGTPSLLLLDRAGVERFRHFGGIDDLQLGATVGGLLATQ